MVITRLTLQNFRSYTKKTFDFSPETTLIVGPNTAGKTNILEAIMFCATGKSFRADFDREAIAWGEELGRISAEVGMPFTSHPSNPHMPSPSAVSKKDMTVLEKAHLPALEKLELVMTSGEVNGQKAPLKKYLVNGVARRQIDFVGNLRAVLFWPEDLELITDSPSLRRKYLDSVLVQVDREYRRNLLSYERGLRQRNRLLDFINEGTAHRHQLTFWNQLLIKAGGYITEKRASYIHYVNSYQLSAISYQLQYDKSVISENRLVQYAEEEVAAKATLVGPHRDDFEIQGKRKKEKGKSEDEIVELSKYGSRGEQRLAILWLKLAELSYIEREVGDRPVLLLDDIFSEFDQKHRELVYELIGKQQTIITSADPHELPSAFKKHVSMVELSI